MSRFFTYCWQHRETLIHVDDEPVGTAYGSQFSRRGVRVGDEVYIVSIHRGHVYLLGKMRVAAVPRSAEEFQRRTGREPVLAPEYLVAEDCTPARHVRLDVSLVRSLRFLRGSLLIPLTFRDAEGGLVDRQSLRSVRRLSKGSAAALDTLLPALAPFCPAAAA